TLARFLLDGIPPSPRGTPQIEVTFDIDANGILSVSAKDRATGKSQSVKIEATTALSKDEVEHLKKEAALHAAEDAAKREAAEVRNQAESAIYLAEKTLREAGEKTAPDLKDEVMKHVEEVKRVKDGEDLAAIKKAVLELSAALQKVGQAMYTQTAPPAGGTPDAKEPEDNGPEPA
ncbi:MAG: Hsp70 family protein, partial [Candidatus Liptonbacteria bacterium]|nr:Hsp70 family protein [Candidatus Liptonbacteria bacterium]